MPYRPTLARQDLQGPEQDGRRLLEDLPFNSMKYILIFNMAKDYFPKKLGIKSGRFH